MAKATELTGAVLTLVAVFCWGASAQSDCTNVLISMSPCLNYITGSSSSPSSQCCSQLASVVRASPKCLCDALNGGGSQLGINVNQTQAMALPTACNVQTPPVSRCSSGSRPGSSPGNSPAGSPNNSGTDEGNGSKTVPSTESKTVPSSEGGGPSAGSSLKSPLSLLAFFGAISYAAISNTY